MADCSELSIKIKDLALQIATEQNTFNLDEIIAEIQSSLPELHRKAIIEAISEATTRQHKEVDELKKGLRSIPRQAKEELKISKQIEKINQLLKDGGLPESVITNAAQTNDTLESLREIRKQLNKDIKNTEPAQIKRIQKQVDNLIKRIESKDILPIKRDVYEPQTKELENLIYQRDLLKDEFRDLRYRSQPKTLLGYVGDAFDTIRLLKTTGEFSLFLRQGGWYVIGHPIKGTQALVSSLKAFSDTKYAKQQNHKLLTRELSGVSYNAGLQLTPIDGSVALKKQEEAIMGHWSSKIPVIKNFNQAGITVLNEIRANAFDVMYETVGQTKNLTPKEAELVANYINVATGRGSLGKFEQHAVLFNRFLFAPKYIASRFQLLLGQPLWTGIAENTSMSKSLSENISQIKENISQTKEVRKLIAMEYARSLTGLAIFYLLASMWPDEDEVKIEIDPRSSDFGKIRIGKTRLDPLMGLSQNTVLLTRLITGEIKSTTTGDINKLYGELKPYNGTDIWKVMTNFGRYKLSPTFGIPINIIARKDPVGKEYSLKNLVITQEGIPGGELWPITWLDIYDAFQEQGVPKGMALSTMAFFGMGLQTYQDKRVSKGKTYK